MGYNWAKRKMKKVIATALFLIGMGTFAFAQDGNICPSGYKAVPASNNNHQVKVVTPSTCTTTTTTTNSGQSNVKASGGVKVVGGEYQRTGATTSKTTTTKQCTQEKTDYYNCEPKKEKSKTK